MQQGGGGGSCKHTVSGVLGKLGLHCHACCACSCNERPVLLSMLGYIDIAGVRACQFPCGTADRGVRVPQTDTQIVAERQKLADDWQAWLAAKADYIAEQAAGRRKIMGEQVRTFCLPWQFLHHIAGVPAQDVQRLAALWLAGGVACRAPAPWPSWLKTSSQACAEPSRPALE